MRHEPQSGLFEEIEHPLWTKPATFLTGNEPAHIKAAYETLWSKMQPFDGRPNSQTVISWATGVWTLLVTESAHSDRWWLVGQIVRHRTYAERLGPVSQSKAVYGITISLIDAIADAS